MPSDLGCKVISPQQPDGEAQQTNDGALYQEWVGAGVVHHDVVDVISDALPERPYAIPDSQHTADVKTLVCSMTLASNILISYSIMCEKLYHILVLISRKIEKTIKFHIWQTSWKKKIFIKKYWRGVFRGPLAEFWFVSYTTCCATTC